MKKWWDDWNATVICEMSKTSWQTGKLTMIDDSENHSNDQKIHNGAMVEYHPISVRDQSRLLQCGKKGFSGFLLGYALIAGGIGKGDILIVDIEELEKLNASEIYPRRNGSHKREKTSYSQ